MIRLGQFGRRSTIMKENSSTTTMSSPASSLLQKGADAQPTLKASIKVKQLNDQILPQGVKVVPFIDRSELLHFTTHTVLHNLTEGMCWSHHSFSFPGKCSRRAHRCAHHSFFAVFAATCLDLKRIPANLLSLGALDFGMVVEGTVVMVENIVRRLGAQR